MKRIQLLWLAILISELAKAQVYPYFSPGGALSGNATSQNVNLAAGTPFIVGTLPAARLPALSGDCTTPGGSGVLTCTQINGVTPGGTCINQAITSLSSSAIPTCTTLTSAFVNNTIALTGVDINTANQVTATHLAAALPVTQGGTGIATLTGLALGNGTSAFSAYGGTGCTNQFPRSLSATGTATCATVANTDLANSSVTLNGASLALGGTRTLTLASADYVNQGTTTTLLHGNAAGNPSFASVANADLTNSSITLNGSSVSLGGTRTLALASADFVNQGTTTTLLHGNAAGNPSFGAVSLTADVTNTLPVANGGTGTASTLTGLMRGSSTAMTAAELSGDVTTAGSNASTITTNAVTNAKLAQMAANTVKCNNTAGTANAIDCTVAQAQTLLSIPGLLDVQTFTGSGTWTKPTTGTPLTTRVICFGSGGGGGSGAQVALGTAESGGGGGGGGSSIDILLTTATLGATETVTIGAAGTGGAATGGVGAGNPGGQGNTSSFGTWGSGLGGGGGAGGASAANSGGGGGAGARGAGGNTTTATGGVAGNTNAGTGGSGTTGSFTNAGAGGAGGAGDTSGAAGSPGGSNWGAAGAGGGAGGGLTAVAATAGGNGGAVPTQAGATGGAATGAIGGNGTLSAAGYVAGGAGAGGGGNAAGAGGAGGTGARGSGGGGGGASAGGNSGAGGAGGPGYCVAITAF